jgi:hypothetical protein
VIAIKESWQVIYGVVQRDLRKVVKLFRHEVLLSGVNDIRLPSSSAHFYRSRQAFIS